MCVTNNVCKFRLSKVSSKNFIFSSLKNIFYAKILLVASDFLGRKYCDVVSILSKLNLLLPWRTIASFFDETFLPSFLLDAMLDDFYRVALKFCWFPKALRIESQELIYSKIMFLKFWVIFAKSLGLVYDEIFSYTKLILFLHPKEVKMKNSFCAISHLNAKNSLSFIFYTKQFFMFKVLEKSFHCFFVCSFLLQVAFGWYTSIFLSHFAVFHFTLFYFIFFFCIYTNVRLQFNVKVRQISSSSWIEKQKQKLVKNPLN